MIAETRLGFVLSKREQFKANLVDFLFPIRIKRSMSTKIRLMVLIGIMISLRLVLSIFSIPLAPTLSISLAWVPIGILGWHIGPVLSIFVGFLSNTIAWSMSGAVFFWMYAIQEPLEMVMAAIIGYIYTHRKLTKLYIDFTMMQVVIFALCVLTLFCMFNASDGIKNRFAKPLRISCIVFLTIFLCTLEFFLFNLYLRKSFENLVLFIYTSTFLILSSFTFSFLLGSFSSIEYFKYISGGKLSPNFQKYGFLFYLFPRIIKETFRLPFLILTFFFVQDSVCIPGFSQLKSGVCFYW